MRVAEGQRPQQQQIRQAEDDAVGGDGERERDDDDGGGAAILDEQPRAEAQVLPESTEDLDLRCPTERERFGSGRRDAGQLADQICVVQFCERVAACLVVRNAGGRISS